MLRSPYPDVVVPEVSIFDYLFGDLSDADAERVALVDGVSGAETTFAEFAAQSLAIAGALAARGIEPGDVVALHCPNTPAFAATFHGILRAGAVVTPVNAMYTAYEIASQLRDSGSKMLVTIGPLLAQAQAAADEVGLDAEHVVVLDGAEGHPNLRDLLSAGAPAPEVSFDPATQLAVLPYSSGTTGTPKGVMLTHRNLVANVCQSIPYIDVDSHDRVLALLPFTHIYGLTVLLNLAVKQRAALVTMPKFDLGEFLRIIQDHRCTFIFIAPPIAVALAKHPMVDNYDTSSVRALLSGAAPADEALMNAVAKRLDASVMQGYGMSETSPVTHAIPSDRPDLSLDSIGFPVPNLDAKVVDIETGAEIEQPGEGLSEPGELCVRGPNIMLGYLNRPDATAETIDADGFLHTGDVARIGAKGEFYIVDRLKELIKYKGHQVPPAELEALLLTHPEIADAAVVGWNDDEGQEVPKAFVVRAEGSQLDAEGVMDFVAERVAPYKKVRMVEFIDLVPKSGSGKILRKDLRAR